MIGDSMQISELNQKCYDQALVGRLTGRAGLYATAAQFGEFDVFIDRAGTLRVIRDGVIVGEFSCVAHTK